MKPEILLPETDETEKESKHVVLTDDPELTLNASRWLAAKQEEADAAATANVIRGEILPITLPRWLEANHGAEKPAASVLLPTPRGELLISYAASWAGKPADTGLPAKYTTQEFDVQVDWDKVPGDKVQGLVNALRVLVTEHGLPKCLKVTNKRVVAKSFALLRHTELSVAENLALEQQGLQTKVSFKAR